VFDEECELLSGYVYDRMVPGHWHCRKEEEWRCRTASLARHQSVDCHQHVLSLCTALLL